MTSSQDLEKRFNPHLKMMKGGFQKIFIFTPIHTTVDEVNVLVYRRRLNGLKTAVTKNNSQTEIP